MTMLDFLRVNRPFPATANNRKLVSEYRQLRKINSRLNNKLVERLSDDAIDKGGKELGIAQQGILVFESEEEMSVLMDYCVHHVRENGHNSIEQYLIDSPPRSDSKEMLCLHAMQYAVYSLFVVESIEPGVGMFVRNVVSRDSFLLAEIGMSSCVEPDFVFASGVLFFDDFAMTTGAAIPLGYPDKKSIDQLKRRYSSSLVPDKNGNKNPAPLIRELLRDGYLSQMSYATPGSHISINSRIENTEKKPGKIGRNSFCPCGSGKKFKHCCISSR